MIWTPTEWTMSPEPVDVPPVTICRIRCGKLFVYAVRQDGACLDAEGNWERESMPSERLNRFCFPTFEDAVRAAETHCTTYGRFLSCTPRAGGRKTFGNATLDGMVRDACLLRTAVAENHLAVAEVYAADVACHVEALAQGIAELERQLAERDGKTEAP